MRLSHSIVLTLLLLLLFLLIGCATEEKKEITEEDLFESSSSPTGAANYVDTIGCEHSGKVGNVDVCSCTESGGLIYFTGRYSRDKSSNLPCSGPFTLSKEACNAYDPNLKWVYSCSPPGATLEVIRCPAACPSCVKSGNTVMCSSNPCGNGICDAGETYTSCPGDCQPVCGNRVVEGTEQCDDGNSINYDGCTACKKDAPSSGCDGIPTTSTECCLPSDMEYIRGLTSASNICPEDTEAYQRILTCTGLDRLDMTFSDIVSRIPSCSSSEPPQATCLPREMSFVIDQLKAGVQPNQIPMTAEQRTIFDSLTATCQRSIDAPLDSPLYLSYLAACLEGKLCPEPPTETCLPDDLTYVIDGLRAGTQLNLISMTQAQRTTVTALVSLCPLPDISSNDPLFLNSLADCLDGQRCTKPGEPSNPCLPVEFQDEVSTLCNPVDDTALTEDQRKLTELIISLGLHTQELTCEQMQSTLSSMPICQASGNPGRMTGGGSFFLGGMRITHGFTLHCNVQNLPNRLEINWAGTGTGKSAENNFHLQTLTTAHCLDDPAISPGSPSAPFDVYEGYGSGLLNGVDGATAHWIFTDAGEPGKDDEVWLVIKNPSGLEILRVGGNWEGTDALSLVPGVAGSATDGADIKMGNQQAHP